MSFVLEWSSFCIHMTKPTDSATLKTTVLSVILKTIRMRHSSETTRFGFSSRNGVRFQFTWYQNDMSYQNENFIRIENRVNSFRYELCEISSRYHVNRNRETYGDGMNSFWNESHSGIMWTAPKMLPSKTCHEFTSYLTVSKTKHLLICHTKIIERNCLQRKRNFSCASRLMKILQFWRVFLSSILIRDIAGVNMGRFSPREAYFIRINGFTRYPRFEISGVKCWSQCRG